MSGARALAPAAGGRVRRADECDLERLSALWSALIRHHAPLGPQFELRADAEQRLRRVLAAQLRDPDGLLLVWDEAGELAGFCLARLDRAPPILSESQRGEISELGVDEAWRRRGIGRALARQALDWLRGRGAPRAEVRVAARNPEGQAFWRSLGFDDLMDVLQLRL